MLQNPEAELTRRIGNEPNSVRGLRKPGAFAGGEAPCVGRGASRDAYSDARPRRLPMDTRSADRVTQARGTSGRGAPPPTRRTPLRYTEGNRQVGRDDGGSRRACRGATASR